MALNKKPPQGGFLFSKDNENNLKINKKQFIYRNALIIKIYFFIVLFFY